MLQKSISLLWLLFLIAQTSFAQHQQYARAQINLKDKNIFLLQKLGIELDHGFYKPGKYIENDFSLYEIDAVRKLGFEVKIIIPDVVAYYSNPNRPSEINTLSSGNRNHCSQAVEAYKYTTPTNYTFGSMGGYHTYDEAIATFDLMKTKFPHLISSVAEIGDFTTVNGNSMWWLKVSNNPNTVDTTKPQVLYTALHHAREPNSLSQMIFYLWYLLENYDTNPEIKYLVDHTEMYFIPIINPDGYQYNEDIQPNGGGLWRKNRNLNNGNAIGVDLNRNYGYEWGVDDDGSSPEPSSETYRGASAFSEVETQAVKYFCEQHKFALALNYHTFGNFLIHPWGFNDMPTSEDQLFKHLGRFMIAENNFTMGTGTETVGYVTNGDSDDYMYGENVAKNAIYSYTPEVGPSFWPPMVDIDYLNRSCMHMNLALPRIVNTTAKVYLENIPRLSLDSNQINLKVDIIGLVPKDQEIRIWTNSNKVMSTPKVLNYNTINTTEQVDFDFQLQPAFLAEIDTVVFYTSVHNGFYTSYDSIALEVRKSNGISLFEDEFEALINWQTTSNGWKTTTAKYISAPTSLTDSPENTYGNNQTKTITLANTIDLKDALQATLVFDGWWDIEEGYDYVQISAIDEIGNAIPLCGNYTSLGTNDQIFGEPLYDGVNTKWVKEFMDLNDFIGQKIKVKIVFHSDGGLVKDGMYIDDMKVLVVKNTGSIEVNNLEVAAKAFPNPSFDLVNFNNIDQFSHFALYNSHGTCIQKGQADALKNGLDMHQLPSGSYLVNLLNDKQKTSKTLTIVKP